MDWAKGTPNRITREVRAAVRDLTAANADRVQEWLDRVAEAEPAEAIRLWLGLLKYVVPTPSATAIADVTPPKRLSDQLAQLTEEDLLAIAHSAQVPAQGALAPVLPDPDDLTNEELLR
jgi:hypothetical protein